MSWLTFGFSQKAGPKQNLIDRIVKKTLAVKQDALTWANVRMEAAVLDPMPGPDSTPGRIRSFYTKSYKSLDQFDQLWSEVQYDKRQNWECNYVWAIVVDSIINGRSAYCESNGVHVSMKDFMRAFMTQLRAHVHENYKK